jgi:predicted NBD/HSP70 family sugar kinase
MPVAATGRRTPAIGFHEMVGPTAVLDLAARHRLPGEDAAAAVAAGVAAGRKGRSFLDELARRLATGLAPIVAVLDPPLVVLAGPTCVAGGDLLVELASHHLRDSSPFRTPLTLTGVPDNPVLSGAVTTAAERARVDLFGDTSVFAAATGRAVGLA